MAVVLSILVIMGFQHWMASRYPQMGEAPQTRAAGTEDSRTTQDDPAYTPPGGKQEASDVRQSRDLEEREYVAQTDKLKVTFSNIEGAIKQIELKEFSDKETGAPYLLMNSLHPEYYAGALQLAGLMADRSPVYRQEKNGIQITFLYDANGIQITKTYRMPKSADYIEIYLKYKNNTTRDIKTASAVSIGSGINLENIMSQRYHYVSAKIDGAIQWFKKDAVKPGNVTWMTLNNEYFCLLLKPYHLADTTYCKLLEKNNLGGKIGSAEFLIPAGSSYTQQYLLYAGPFDAGRLAALDLGLEEAVNYGKLHGIVKILLSTLSFFQTIVKNWGVAIILMTALVNLALFPLTKNSYKSMKAAQELQPQIEKLRNAHKDNPQKAQKEIMELYRQYKVNPMSGCLPMFLQFPIFFALYHALMRSVVLKGSNFLWIKDLSKPDSLGLPFSLPFLGDSVNILPIITAGVMFLQQKVMSAQKSPNASDQMKQQQAMMAILIPGMMLVFFYNMPSGFVLYFLVNSALMAFVQYRIKQS